MIERPTIQAVLKQLRLIDFKILKQIISGTVLRFVEEKYYVYHCYTII